MAREGAQEKGRRLLTEGRLRVLEVGRGNGRIVAACRGDSARDYMLGFDPHDFEWRCTCEARGICSHIVALQLVTNEPTPKGGTLP